MTQLVFDIETDGLLGEMTKIHCLAINDLETNQTITYNDEGNTEPIVRGIQRLEDAACILGHGIINFDLPAIRTIYPWFSQPSLCVDTLLLSNLLHTDLIAVDKIRKWPGLPLRLYGRHSLEAYGYRLNCRKGDYGKTSDWKHWSQEMEDYCKQDVAVTRKLVEHFIPKLK